MGPSIDDKKLRVINQLANKKPIRGGSHQTRINQRISIKDTHRFSRLLGHGLINEKIRYNTITHNFSVCNQYIYILSKTYIINEINQKIFKNFKSQKINSKIDQKS